MRAPPFFFFFLSFAPPKEKDHGSSSSFFSGSGAGADSGSEILSSRRAAEPFLLPKPKPQPSSSAGFSSSTGADASGALSVSKLKSNPFTSFFFLSADAQILSLPADWSFEESSNAVVKSGCGGAGSAAYCEVSDWQREIKQLRLYDLLSPSYPSSSPQSQRFPSHHQQGCT